MNVKDIGYTSELRLFVEDICSDLSLFKHVVEVRDQEGGCRIDREFHLGVMSSYADIRVSPAGAPHYFIEVKFGYSRERLLETLRRKYAGDSEEIRSASTLILVVDKGNIRKWNKVESKIREFINPCLKLDVWDETALQGHIKRQFGINIGEITDQELLDVRERIENAMGFHAFGGEKLKEYENSPLRSELLWLLGPVTLRYLREAGRVEPRNVIPPGRYQRVAVLMADLSSFSSFVRDTPEPDITRECLTSFCSKARYQIVNSGGMLYQFVGDAVLGFFGIPESSPNSVEKCLEAGKAILDIGDSISDSWQRQIDRIQPSHGAHIGLTIGDIELQSLRPFSRTRIGAFGDAINMSARLSSAVGGGEIAVSNSFYNKLSQPGRNGFVALNPVDGRNVGRIKAWKLDWSDRYGGFGETT
jgi:adenylate cyclase